MANAQTVPVVKLRFQSEVFYIKDRQPIGQAIAEHKKLAVVAKELGGHATGFCMEREESDHAGQAVDSCVVVVPIGKEDLLEQAYREKTGGNPYYRRATQELING